MSRLISSMIFFHISLMGAAHAVTCDDDIPPSNPSGAYIDHGDGTVSDIRTGLMWKQCTEGQAWPGCGGSVASMNWAAALEVARLSSFAGHQDWRVPNIKEMNSLVEECRTSPTINDAVFPNTPASGFWTGSPNVDNSGTTWAVGFSGGTAGGNHSRSNLYHVRLVRTGQ